MNTPNKLVRFPILIFCAFTALFPACSESKKSVRGQVFVIQKNRVNVKLGGVTIRFVPFDKVRERCKWISLNYQNARNLSDHTHQLSEIDSSLRKLRESPVSHELNGFISACEDIQSRQWKALEENPRLDMISKINLGSTLFGAEVDSWIMSAMFGEWLERTEFSNTETDADGNYFLDLPRDAKGYIFVSANRDLPGTGDEQYWWIREISGEETNAVNLTTQNTIDSSTLTRIVFENHRLPEKRPDEFRKEFGLSDPSWFRKSKPLTSELESNRAKSMDLQRKISAKGTEASQLQSQKFEHVEESDPKRADQEAFGGFFSE